jgi:hypothetical protein
MSLAALIADGEADQHPWSRIGSDNGRGVHPFKMAGMMR